MSSKLSHLLILDFEATCWDGGAKRPQEIIEFPCLVYDLSSNAVERTFHEYVKPELEPTLSRFCTDLTGIEQETVDKADTFPGVWSRFNDFIAHNLIGENTSFAFLTCGDWDLRTMLPTQLSRLEDEVAPEFYRSWINVKIAYRQHYAHRRSRGLPRGMMSMLNDLGLKLEGRHHSGIDDCRNIARIVTRMRENGWEPSLTSLVPHRG